MKKKEFKNIEDAKKTFFSLPEFEDIDRFLSCEIFAAKIDALEYWYRTAKAQSSIIEIASISKLMEVEPSDVYNLSMYADTASTWMKLSRLKIEYAQSFDDFKKLLEDDSIDHKDDGIIIEKMIDISASQEDLDFVAEKNDFKKFYQLIFKKRIEVAKDVKEIKSFYNSLQSREDRVSAIIKWATFVSTSREIKQMDAWAHLGYYDYDSEFHEVGVKHEQLSKKEAESAVSAEELRAVYENAPYRSDVKVIVGKKWDRLCLKEVEAITSTEELKIAMVRFCEHSQAWYIAQKRIKAK